MNPRLPLEARTAGGLALLFGLPLTQIRRITTADVHTTGDHTYFELGRHPLFIPPRLGALLHQVAASPLRRSLLPIDGPNWLFPGLAPGEPLFAQALGDFLQRHFGVSSRATRQAALIAFASELPPPVLADLLGLTVQTAQRWASYTQPELGRLSQSQNGREEARMKGQPVQGRARVADHDERLAAPDAPNAREKRERPYQSDCQERCQERNCGRRHAREIVAMSLRLLGDVVDGPDRKCEADGHRSDSHTDEQTFSRAQCAHVHITSHISLRNGPGTTVRCAAAGHQSVVVNAIGFAAELRTPVVAELFELSIQPPQRWTCHTQPNLTAHLRGQKPRPRRPQRGIAHVTNIYVPPVRGKEAA